jgi:hypothetical protein
MWKFLLKKTLSPDILRFANNANDANSDKLPELYKARPSSNVNRSPSYIFSATGLRFPALLITVSIINFTLKSCAKVVNKDEKENEAEFGSLYLVAELTYEKLTYTLCKQQSWEKVQKSSKKFNPN